MRHFLAAVALAAATAFAQETPAELEETVQESSGESYVIIGTSPLPGVGLDRDKVPGNTQSLSAGNLTLEGSASLTTSLSNQLGSISVNDNHDSPFQPDILYRGFEASPVLGTPQGLAVYQNGVRINEAFGDTVNWDLIPELAIARTDILSSPIYGLNAMGGAVAITMKNGFNYQKGEAELSGGSFWRRAASLEYGGKCGNVAAYVAGRSLNEEGWRQFSSSSLSQLYASLSVRTDKLSVDLSFTGAYNKLNAIGATPVQSLAIDRSLVFTSPQSNLNQLAFVTLSGQYAATQTLSLQANTYYRGYGQSVVNGNTTDYTSCTTAPHIGFVCQGDGLTPLSDASGQLLLDISVQGSLPLGVNDSESIISHGVGGALQTTLTAPVFGLENYFSLGGAIDFAATDFQTASELGTINKDLLVSSSGLFVSTPQNTPFNATPVSLGATTTYYGVYVTDTFNLLQNLALTASGRFNIAFVNLADRRGTDLSGNSTFMRFNPAGGFTYKLFPFLTIYAGYSGGNRAPTASEIECANPLKPCLLPSSLSSDPPLRQVTSQTYEAGLRGVISLPKAMSGQIGWNAGFFRTDISDDIYGVVTSLGSGYFTNIEGTRRQGAEIGFVYSDQRLSGYVNYSFVDATFQSAFTHLSPFNTGRDANGNISVTPGNHLPGIPQHRVKTGADYKVMKGWIVGVSFAYASEQYYRGDESNQMVPLPFYIVFNLHSTYQVASNIELFATLNNVPNLQYATFGVLGDPTGIGAPGIALDALTNGPGVDSRFQSPAAPIAGYGGLRIKF